MSQCLIPVLDQALWEQEHFASLGYIGKATDLYRMSDSLFVNAHTNFSCQISACIFRYWENGQLFLKCLTHVAVRALLKISLSICQTKGESAPNPWAFLKCLEVFGSLSLGKRNLPLWAVIPVLATALSVQTLLLYSSSLFFLSHPESVGENIMH